MSLSVLIVDDEPLARSRVKGLLAREGDVREVLEAEDGEAAVRVLRETRPDIVFLDVQMPGRDGFGVIEAIGPEQMPATVFVTAFDQHALRAFDVHAVDYLLKPFDDERFTQAFAHAREQRSLKAVARAASALRGVLDDVVRDDPTARHAGTGAGQSGGTRYTDRVMVKHEGRSYVVKLADIRVIESDGNYVHLHDAKSKHIIRETLSALESRLDPTKFVRIHRRLIVNIEAVKELQPWFGGDQVMLLNDGTKLRVSRTFREQVARALEGKT
ncbi:MAG: response regulator transcription factor [Gemmatimonadaceae bacterium]|nr:response regulator transcription factor [Gemmatimonadaceae bacterium]